MKRNTKEFNDTKLLSRVLSSGVDANRVEEKEFKKSNSEMQNDIEKIFGSGVELANIDIHSALNTILHRDEKTIFEDIEKQFGITR